MIRSAFNIGLIVVLASIVAPCIRAELPVPPGAEGAPVERTQQTYKGRTFEDWNTEFHTKLDPELRKSSLRALIVFGANGKAKEVVEVLLRQFDSYRIELAVAGATHQLEELLEEFKGEVSAANEDDDGVDKEHTSARLAAWGFIDRGDAELFWLASAGMARLAHLAVPDLEQYATKEGTQSSGQLVALGTLFRQPGFRLSKILPKIIARDDLISQLALEMMHHKEVAWPRGEYELCLREVFKGQPDRILELLGYVANETDRSRTTIVLPLLSEFARTADEPRVKEALANTILKLQQPAKNTPNVVPAGGKTGE